MPHSRIVLIMFGEADKLNWAPAPQSWYDLVLAHPPDPRGIIEDVHFNNINGAFLFSTNYSTPAVGWSASPLTLQANPFCSALQTDNQLAVAQAQQWNFENITANLSTDLPPSLRALIFLRGGTSWKNSVPFSLSAEVSELQISFIDNAATAGYFVGASSGGIPALVITGSFTGNVNLDLTLSQFGYTSFGLRTTTLAGGEAFLRLDCIVVP